MALLLVPGQLPDEGLSVVSFLFKYEENQSKLSGDIDSGLNVFCSVFFFR